MSEFEVVLLVVERGNLLDWELANCPIDNAADSCRERPGNPHEAQQEGNATTGGPDALEEFPASSVATTFHVMLPSTS
jgi:hypothetical protein